ncbi:MAG TPA: hypothetical protein VG309_11860 [Rhizomicrobium sp.]|nr:hypothetical protein [Rhizomicrobium sp.]
MKKIVLACAVALATVGTIGAVAPATAAITIHVGSNGHHHWHHTHCWWRHGMRHCRHW